MTVEIIDVVHVISGLDDGGAEAVLNRLVTFAPAQRRYHHRVVSLSSAGKFGPLLGEAGIEVATLDMSRRIPNPVGLLKLTRLLKLWRPSLVQTWMYHADLLGALATRVAGIPHLVWGVHHASLAPAELGWTTYAVVRACAWLSRWPSATVSVSQRGADAHRAAGYIGPIQVIPNGYDLDRFRPRAAGDDLRAEWCQARGEAGNGAPEFLCGVVARWHPLKGHGVLFEALAALKRRGVRIGCVLVGTGMTSDNEALDAALNRAGLRSDVLLLGARNDIPQVMSALDVHVLPSLGEAFPNVVAEAMACGTPCLVSDVGDAAMIVGDLGWIVPAGDSESLVSALEAARQEHAEHRALQNENGSTGAWAVRQAACRARIAERFSVRAMFDGYDRLWREVLDHRLDQ